MDTIGARMRALREGARLSQTDIAKLCGSNQATIGKMETGRTLPSVKILVWWADYFDVSMDYLCCRTDEPYGKLYECKPKTNMSGEDMKQFVEMCFDPGSPYSRKLKDAIIQMMGGEKP